MYFAVLLRPKPSRPRILLYFCAASLPDIHILSYFCDPSLPDLRILSYFCVPSLEDTEEALESTSGKPPGERVLKIGKCVLEPLFGRSRGGPQEGTKIQRLSASKTHVFSSSFASRSHQTCVFCRSFVPPGFQTYVFCRILVSPAFQTCIFCRILAPRAFQTYVLWRTRAPQALRTPKRL